MNTSKTIGLILAFLESNGVPSDILIEVSEYLGDGNTQSLEDGNWKIEIVGDFLKFFRRETGVWVERANFGSSVTTDRFIIEDTAGSVVFIDSLGGTNTLLKPSIDETGAVLGNPTGRVALIHNGEIFSVEFDDTIILEDQIQTSTAQFETGIDFEYEFVTKRVESLITGEVSLANVPAGTTARVSLLSTDDVLLTESVSEFDFNNGNGEPVSDGLNEIPLRESLALSQNFNFKVRLQVSNSCDIQGDTVDLSDGLGVRFVPYLVIDYYLGEQKNITTDDKLIQRQITRSGVKTGFSVSSITADTQVQITADSGTDFDVYFNLNDEVDNNDGFTIQVQNQVVNVINDPVAKRFHVSVDSAGNIITTENKTSLDDLARVHLFTYTALNGTLISTTLLANPHLSYSDRTLQGILETDGVRVNKLEISGQDNATLGIESSSFDLIGNANNWSNDKINPHVINVPAIDPLNWTYLTQTVTIPPAVGGEVLLIPDQYDNAGTLTPVPIGTNNSTVQLVMITPVKEFVILFGQQVFPTFDDALLNAGNLEFVLPPALFGAVEVARIVINRDATDSSDIDQVSIINTIDGAGGSGEVPQSDVFFDGDFTLENSTDVTKKSRFDASKQGAGTVKVHKLPADNSELMTIDLDELITGEKNFEANKLRISTPGDPTTRAEFVTSRVPAGSTNSYILKARGGVIETERAERRITGNRTLTDVDVDDNLVLTIEVDAGNTVVVNFPDVSYDGAKIIDVNVVGNGKVIFEPLGLTTINDSTDNIEVEFVDKRQYRFIHEGEETQTWYVDLGQRERVLAWVKFNPNKTTNGEVSYRNAGVGFRVFRTGVGLFSIENDGTILNELPDVWAVRAASGSEATIKVSSMIAGISGFTANIESWGSTNGANTGQPGTLSLRVRDAVGITSDVTNANGHIYIEYVEI